VKRYLLDTNHLRPAIERISALRERICQQVRLGDRFGTCVPVLCELQAALSNNRRSKEYQRNLAALFSGSIRLWPLEPPVDRVYGDIYHDLRRRGRVLSQVDMMLAALARHMDLILLTADQDFDTLADLQRENWL
jgi:tRNA(fMet)-specific endonuclease VapC